MTADALSEVLRAVRLRGAVFFDVLGRDPWVAEAPPASSVGPYIMPGVEHVIEYHVVTSGSCYGGIVGETPFPLAAGDVLVFPQGDAHVMSSAPGMRGEMQTAHETLGPGSLPISMSVGGGGDASVHLICGFSVATRAPSIRCSRTCRVCCTYRRATTATACSRSSYGSHSVRPAPSPPGASACSRGSAS